jgi:large subunit ribosomal protein L28
MAFKCHMCGKRPRVANKISHSNIKTKKRQRPNLHRVHVVEDGKHLHVRVCTRCLRSGKVAKAV